MCLSAAFAAIRIKVVTWFQDAGTRCWHADTCDAQKESSRVHLSRFVASADAARCNMTMLVHPSQFTWLRCTELLCVAACFTLCPCPFPGRHLCALTLQSLRRRLHYCCHKDKAHSKLYGLQKVNHVTYSTKCKLDIVFGDEQLPGRLPVLKALNAWACLTRLHSSRQELL